MKDFIKKELISYYIEQEKLKTSFNSKDKVRLNIINTIIKRIKFILKVSKYEKIDKIIEFEKILLNNNLNKNIDTLDQLYILKWLEYSKFLDRVSIKKINYS